jgi:hypothetical protein
MPSGPIIQFVGAKCVWEGESVCSRAVSHSHCIVCVCVRACVRARVCVWFAWAVWTVAAPRSKSRSMMTWYTMMRDMVTVIISRWLFVTVGGDSLTRLGNKYTVAHSLSCARVGWEWCIDIILYIYIIYYIYINIYGDKIFSRDGYKGFFFRWPYLDR